jgi:chromosome segregation ATPase
MAAITRANSHGAFLQSDTPKKDLDYLRRLLETDKAVIEEALQTSDQAPEKESNKISKWTSKLRKITKQYTKPGYDNASLKNDIDFLEDIAREIDRDLEKLPDESSEYTEELKQFRTRLQKDVLALKKKYETGLSDLANSKNEQDLLQIKLKSRTGVEEVVLQLFQQSELVKQRLNHEIKRRAQLEILLEVEVNELNRRLLMEANAREEVRLQLEQALRIRNSIFGDLQLLKSKLELILDRCDAHVELNQLKQSTAPTSSAELLDLIAMTQDIDSQLAALDELVDPANLDILPVVDAQTKHIEKLNLQTAQEISARKILEEKNTALETQARQLERQLAEERQARIALEKRVEAEIAELKRMAKVT